MRPAKFSSDGPFPFLVVSPGERSVWVNHTLSGVQAATLLRPQSTKRAMLPVGEAAPAALGTTAKYASTQATPSVAEHRKSRWALQNKAAKLMPHERVADCMRAVQSQAMGVTLLYSSATQTAHYGGLETCGSVWMCPICAAKITERRRTELAQAVKAAREQGLQIVMCTFTFSHHRGDQLQVMMNAMRQAFKRYKSGRAAESLRRKFSLVGTVRALEVTHSEENGWHPHIHELCFLPKEVDAQAFGRACRSAWERAAALSGLVLNQHGFRLDTCDSRIVDYVTKFGREPGEATQAAWAAGWNETMELTKWHIKKGRASLRDASEHLTPFGLLRYAAAGDVRAGQLFQEYARCFKGLRQLHWSPMLRQLLDLADEKTDEELAQESQEEAVAVAYLTGLQWAIVLANDCRAELLEVASTGDAEKVWQFLKLLLPLESRERFEGPNV